MLALGCGLLVIAFTVGVFADRPIIEPDLSTYVLPGIARSQGLGALYIDYLDIKPPLTFGFFAAWTTLAGPSLAGLWLAYILLLAGLLTGFWLLLRRELPAWAALLLFASCSAVVVFFVMLEEFFFVTEVIGMTLIMWALVLATRWGNRLTVLGGAAFLLGAAGQVKEVFLLAPVALLPIAWRHPTRGRALLVLVGGVVVAVLLTIGVLLWWGEGVLSAYLDVLQIKRVRFSAPGPGALLQGVRADAAAIGQWLPYLWVFLAALVAAVVLGRRRGPGLRAAAGMRQSATWGTPETALALAFPAMAVGFLWQGSDLLKYYAVAIVFPTYLLLAVLLRVGLRGASTTATPVRVALTALLIIGLAPPLSAVLWFGGRAKAMEPVANVRSIMGAESDGDVASYRALAALVPDDGCLHVAYGAWAATTYLYAGVPSCTRFMAPGLAVATPDLSAELRESLVQRPPDVLVVDRDLMIDPNLEEGRLEKALLPMEDIAAACFDPAPNVPDTFVMRGSAQQASACIADALAATDQSGMTR